MLNIDIIKINLLNHNLDYFYEFIYSIKEFILDNNLEHFNINITPNKESIKINNGLFYINNKCIGNTISLTFSIYNQLNETSISFITNYRIDDIDNKLDFYLCCYNGTFNSLTFAIDSLADFEKLIEYNSQFKLFYDGIIKKIKPLHYFLSGVENEK
jgi:hypothetical protein